MKQGMAQHEEANNHAVRLSCLQVDGRTFAHSAASVNLGSLLPSEHAQHLRDRATLCRSGRPNADAGALTLGCSAASPKQTLVMCCYVETVPP